MQVIQLSALILTAFLIGCVSPNATRELEEAPQHAATILGGTTEVAAGETAEELNTVSLSVEKKQQRENVVRDLWWTWKYTMWGQGSAEDWPWSW